MLRIYESSKSRYLIAICLLLPFALIGCEENNVTNPVSTNPDLPPTNNSQVVPRAGGVCPVGGPCIADFSVTLFGGDAVSWLFTGATPPTSPAAAGDVRWLTPGGKGWSSNVCNAIGCTAAQGTATFTSASTISQLAESIGLIESHEMRDLEDAFKLAYEMEGADFSINAFLTFAVDVGILDQEEVGALRALIERQ